MSFRAGELSPVLQRSVALLIRGQPALAHKTTRTTAMIRHGMISRGSAWKDTRKVIALGQGQSLSREGPALSGKAITQRRQRGQQRREP